MRVLEYLVNLPLIAAFTWIAIDWGVTGHMQRRVFQTSGKTVSRFKPLELGENYRAGFGDDASYRFHKRTRIVILLLVLAWIAITAFAQR